MLWELLPPHAIVRGKHYIWVSMIRDGPKLLDDGEEIPKSQRRGWQFDSRL